MACEVCEGSGDYPVINKYGQTLYCIRCPDCSGTGDDEQQSAARAEKSRDRERYARVMSEGDAA